MWVELKSTGEKPSKLQRERFREMESIGHSVAVLDSKEAVDGFMAVVELMRLAPDSASTGAEGGQEAGLRDAASMERKEAGDEV